MNNQSSQALASLTKAIVHFEDGDVLRLAQWLNLLAEARQEVPESQGPLIDDLTALVRGAIREGTPEGFLETLGRGLDQISLGLGEADDGLWDQHGPAFVAEAKSRLARAQDLVLALEAAENPEAVGELFRIVHTIKGEAGFLHQSELAAKTHRLEELLDSLRAGNQAIDEVVIDHLLGGVDELVATLNPPEIPISSPNPEDPGTEKVVTRVEEILRIPASKIDSLVALVGELLIALESETEEPSMAVRKLSRGLQQSALRLRTEPLKDLLGRIKRGTRDLAKDLGKPIEVVVTGSELELDRNLIANLEEPLMHLVRNSLDHGIEPAEQREKLGKSRQGTLRLAARRKGNRILLSVADDGKGLNTDRIWTKARERGLVTGDRPEDVAQVHALIFQPGFSTAETLTQVSGRGVGMDIVSSVVTANRGQVDLKSVPGQGTEITLTFPLSTAVLEGLVVRSGVQRYVIPVNSAIETLRIGAQTLKTVAPGSQIFSLRGKALPVLSLRSALSRAEESVEPTWGVVVETSDGVRQVLLVEEVEAKKEVVIRSLGSRFQHLKGVSAVTILAGGALALVLDIDQLVQLSEVVS